MVKLFSLGALLFALWVAFSTFLEPLYLIFGLISVGLSLYLAKRLGLLTEDDFPHMAAIRLPLYWLWLGIQVLQSNLKVARLVLSRQPRLHQRFLHVHATQRSELGKAIFANSITLTPGTVTVLAEGDQFLVHALCAQPGDQAALEDMDRRVSAVEGKP